MGRPAPIFLACRGHRAPSLLPSPFPLRSALSVFLSAPAPSFSRPLATRWFATPLEHERVGSRTAKRGLHNYSGRASRVFLGQWDCGSMGQWTLSS